MRTRIERCLAPLLIATGTLPLPALLGCSCGENLLLWTMGYFMAACLCTQVRGRWRMAAGAGLGAAMGAACIMRFVHVMQPVVLLVGAGYVILLLAGLPAQRDMTHAAVFAGVAVHALGQIFLGLAEGGDSAAQYAPARLPMLLGLMVFLAFALLALNRAGLRAALPDGKTMPVTIRRRNQVLVWLMLALALLISLIPALGQLLEKAWEWLRRAIVAVVRWLFSLQMGQSTGGTGGSAPEMGLPGEAAEPSALALWLEKALLIVAMAVLVLAVAWAAYKLWKKLLVLVRWLLKRLQSYAASASEDYVDEMQDTRPQGEEGFSLKRLRRRSLTARELSALPPRERVRARYGQLRLKHPDWADSATARQTLPENKARIYERARYSDHEITEEDAQAFHS